MVKKFIRWLTEPTYTGPTMEEIKRDMQPDPNYVPDPSLLEFAKTVSAILEKEKNNRSRD